MADQGTKEPSTVQEDLPPAKFWAQRGLKAYDHTIFEGPGVGPDSLKASKSFQHAAKLFYEMRNGETWEQKCAREGLNPDSATTKDKLGEYGIDSMRWFQNNIGSTAVVASDISKGTNEQKIAALYLIQSYAHSKVSAGGVVDALWQNAIDPTNALSIGVGIFSGGTGTAAAQAARLGAQRTLISTIKSAVGHAIQKQYGRLVTEAVIGATGNVVQDSIEQSAKMEDIKVDGSIVRLQNTYNTGETLFTGGVGLGVGFGLGLGGHALGAAGRWGSDKLGWTGKPVTPSPSSGPHNDVVLEPYQSIIHTIARRNPFQWVNERVAGFTHPDGASKAWRNIPTRDLFAHKFINPIINHVDDKVSAAGLIDPILKMRRDLEQLRLEMASAGDAQKQGQISQQAETLLKDFSRDNKAKFLTLKNSLTDLKTRLNSPDLKLGGPGTGMAGLDGSEVEALKKWLRHINRLCDAAQDEQSLIKLFNDNRKIFNDANKSTEGVTGAFQHYLALGADAQLRTQTRDLMRLSPDLLHLNPFRTRMGYFARKLEKLDEKLEKNEITKQQYDIEKKAIPLNTFRSQIQDGDDGSLVGGLFHRHKPYYENILRLQREIKDGYYNDQIRTQSMINNRDLNRPDNMENYGIVITRSFEELKDDPKKLSDKLIGLAFQSYDVGREGDFLNALRRLGMQQGRAGATYTIPKEFADDLLLKGRMARNLDKDAHIKAFVDAAKQLANTEHSPQLYGSRDLEKMLEKFTRLAFDARVAPGTNVIGIPGRIYLLNWPLSATWNYGITTLTGGRVIPNVDGQGKILPNKPPTKAHWDFWNAAPQEATGTQRLWHELTARNFALTWLATPVTLPLRVAGQVKDHLIPVWHHTWRGFALAGALGGTLTAGQMAYEWQFDDSLKYHPGKALLRGEVHALDAVFGTPIRASAWAGEKIFNTALNTQWGLIGLGAGLRKFDHSKTFGENLSPTLVDSSIVADHVWTPIPTGWLEHTVAPAAASAAEPTPAPIPAEPKLDEKDQKKADAPNTDSQKTGEKKPADLVEKEKVRGQLRAFGMDTVNLASLIAANGYEADENKKKDAQKEIDKLIERQKTLETKTLDLGPYALSIYNDAGSTLAYLKDGGIPDEVKTFEEIEAARQAAKAHQVMLWHNGVLDLNHQVSDHGWDDKRKKFAEALDKMRANLSKDVLFLGEDIQKAYAQADTWETALLAASRINAKTRKAIAEPARLSDQFNGTQKDGARPATDGKLETPDTGLQDTLGQQLGLSDNTGVDSQSPDRETGATRDKKGGSTKGADKNTDTSADGMGGGTGSSTKRGRRSDKEKGLLEHGRDMKDAFLDGVGVSGDDPVTRVVDSGLGMLGAGISTGAGFLKDTFYYLKGKKDGSGRALIREGGAAVSSFLAMALFIGPTMDKMGMGNSLFKIAALVITFMIARKAFDMGMGPVSVQGTDRNAPHKEISSTGGLIQPANGGAIQKIVPVINVVDLNKEVDGIERLTVNMVGDKAVMQIKGDNGARYVAIGTADGETVIQSTAKGKFIHLPSAFLGQADNSKINNIPQAVKHGDAAGDSLTVHIGEKDYLFVPDTGPELRPN
ncbi:MAG: hypothetical protein WBK55_05100 [Alphaproteobacteria bacterium]